MHVTIARAELVRALTSARGTVPSRSTIPILGNVKMHANGFGRLEITGTDLDRQCIDSGAARIEAPGAATVPADLLAQIAKALPDGDVSLRHNPTDGRLDVACGRARYKLSTLPAEDYPDMAGNEPGALRYVLASSVVKRMFLDLAFATSTDEARPYLQGCHMHTPDRTSTLRVEVTDGHRLIVTDVAIPDGAPPLPAPGVIVPALAMRDIGRMADESDGDVTLSITGSRIAATVGPIAYTAKLIDGAFPDVGRVLPPIGQPNAISVDRRELDAAVGRIMAVLDAKLPRISMRAEGGELILAGARGGDHEGSDAIPADDATGKLEGGISGRYLADQLAAMRGTRVRIEMHSPGSPYRLIDDGAPSDGHVIMPVRV